MCIGVSVVEFSSAMQKDRFQFPTNAGSDLLLMQ